MCIRTSAVQICSLWKYWFDSASRSCSEYDLSTLLPEVGTARPLKPVSDWGRSRKAFFSFGESLLLPGDEWGCAEWSVTSSYCGPKLGCSLLGFWEDPIKQEGGFSSNTSILVCSIGSPGKWIQPANSLILELFLSGMAQTVRNAALYFLLCTLK